MAADDGLLVPTDDLVASADLVEPGEPGEPAGPSEFSSEASVFDDPVDVADEVDEIVDVSDLGDDLVETVGEDAEGIGAIDVDHVTTTQLRREGLTDDDLVETEAIDPDLVEVESDDDELKGTHIDLAAVDFDDDLTAETSDESVELSTLSEEFDADSIDASEVGAEDSVYSDLESGDGELEPVGVVAEDGEQPYQEPVEEEQAKPRVHWLTYSLIGLNVVAALVYPYLLIMDQQKRQDYIYAVRLHDVAILGLPNEDEETVPTAARATLPNHRITAPYIKQVVSDRGVTFGGDSFAEVDEPIAPRIPPSELDRDTLKLHFGEHFVEEGELINTVEAELRRLDKRIRADMKKAADDGLLLLNSDGAKRDKIEKLLMPLAIFRLPQEKEIKEPLSQETDYLKKLDAKIKAATGKELDDLYLEAAQRRMAFDFLLPIEMFRPGDTSVYFLEKFGDLEETPLEKILDRVSARVKAPLEKGYDPALHLGPEWAGKERDSIEKRISTAYLMLALAQLKKPDGEPLFPKLSDRIPLVMGQFDYTLALSQYPSRIQQMNERILEQLRLDREGFEATDKDGKQIWAQRFLGNYESELQRIRFTQLEIQKANLRLKDLQAQKNRYDKLLEERVAQRADVMARIAKARSQTAKDNAEIKILQKELFEYQTELADSEFHLEQIARQIQDKLGRKGGGARGGK